MIGCEAPALSPSEMFVAKYMAKVEPTVTKLVADFVRDVAAKGVPAAHAEKLVSEYKARMEAELERGAQWVRQQCAERGIN